MKIFTFGIAVLVMSLGIIRFTWSQDSELDALLKDIESIDSMIRGTNIQVKYTIDKEFYPEGQQIVMSGTDLQGKMIPDYRYHRRWDYDVTTAGGKLRVDEKVWKYREILEDGNLESKEIWSFDGEKTRVLHYDYVRSSAGDSPQEELQCLTKSGLARNVDVLPTPLNFFCVVGLGKKTDYLGEALKSNTEVTLDGQKPLNNVNYWVVNGKRDNGEISWNLWLNPEIGFKPYRLETTSARYHTVCEAGEYTQSSGIYILKEGISHTYFKKTTEQMVPVVTTKVLLKDMKFSTGELDISQFMVECPPEAKVMVDLDTDLTIEKPTE